MCFFDLHLFSYDVAKFKVAFYFLRLRHEMKKNGRKRQERDVDVAREFNVQKNSKQEVDRKKKRSSYIVKTVLIHLVFVCSASIAVMILIILITKLFLYLSYCINT